MVVEDELVGREERVTVTAADTLSSRTIAHSPNIRRNRIVLAQIIALTRNTFCGTWVSVPLLQKYDT